MIKEFQGDYRFLSNFCKMGRPIHYSGIEYPTVEHFYVAMKTRDACERMEISKCISPGLVKKMGRDLDLREDWDEIKQDVMRFAVQWKFSENADLKELLLATGNQEIQEGNTWGDTYWGVDLFTGVGENRLGKLLMDVREGLRNE